MPSLPQKRESPAESVKSKIIQFRIYNMLSFIKKAITSISTLFLIVSFTFLLLFLIPGDPVDFILKDGASLEG